MILVVQDKKLTTIIPMSEVKKIVYEREDKILFVKRHNEEVEQFNFVVVYSIVNEYENVEGMRNVN